VEREPIVFPINILTTPYSLGGLDEETRGGSAQKSSKKGTFKYFEVFKGTRMSGAEEERASCKDRGRVKGKNGRGGGDRRGGKRLSAFTIRLSIGGGFLQGKMKEPLDPNRTV